MGAIASGGARLLNEDIVAGLEIQSTTVDQVAAGEEVELLRRETAYREVRPKHELAGRTILLVDDGAATGASLRVAITALRQFQPARIVAAVPVASPGACARISHVADAVVCAATPEPFRAVALWYEAFEPVDDATVHDLLAEAFAREEALP
jgi:putative phosphoribosyl transferase